MNAAWASQRSDDVFCPPRSAPVQARLAAIGISRIARLALGSQADYWAFHGASSSAAMYAESSCLR